MQLSRNTIVSVTQSAPHAALGIAAFAVAFALVAGFASSINAAPAFAEDIDTEFEISALQQQIEDSQSEYEAAVARSEECAQQIEANQAVIDDLAQRMPEAREKARAAAVELYKTQSRTGSLLDFIFSAQDFADLLSKVDYMNRVTQANLSAISELEEMESALNQAQADLQTQKDEADAQAAAADSALQAAQSARLDAQRRAQEEAQAAAEAAAAATAAAAAATSDATPAETVAEAMDNATVDSDNATVTDDADWSSDEEAFISEWASRIDTYLSGTPLSGYGRTFAQAAWDYGVDPRWSPAISYVESSCGLYCFKPHNAWGWGSVSWDSWEQAIRGHVSGLARGYGYTLSMSAAQKYCPPNSQHWYDTCLAQMNKI